MSAFARGFFYVREDDEMKLFGTMKISDNMVEVGGVTVAKLAEEYGTPLYIIDEEQFKNTIADFKYNFLSNQLKTNVIYASKALLNLYIAKIIDEAGLSLDVVSGGELYTALQAGFPPERIYFHGNNKLEKELRMAIESNVGTIVADNELEIEILSDLLQGYKKTQKVLLRVNPGIDAHTHEYIKTSKNDSKFGVSIFDEDTIEIIKRIDEDEYLEFKGLHCHIGSQIFQEDSFLKGSETMLDYISNLEKKENIPVEELNLGGGFGVYYTEEDKPFRIASFLKKLTRFIEDYSKKKGLHLKQIDIEPGRSLINNSGSTLYSVGGVKKTFGGKNYIFVDGGMTDNIRPALYQAEYEGVIANKAEETPSIKYTIAGKCCESGDLLIKDIMLPQAERNDLFLINSTGAYNYSMSSNYNRIEKPAMVFVKQGESKLAVRREEYSDLIANDVLL